MRAVFIGSVYLKSRVMFGDVQALGRQVLRMECLCSKTNDTPCFFSEEDVRSPLTFVIVPRVLESD